MDAFYASVEQRDDPSLKGRPVAVGGSPESRGVVAAASYEARAFGVRSALPMSRAVRLCPELVIVRPDFAKYGEASRQVFAIFREVTPLVQPLSLDEAFLDVTENAWGEPLAVNVARRIKARIREETHLTASAGVAPNKFLAKIASGWKKPDGLTVISPDRIESFLQQQPVDALWGVGPVTAGKLRAKGILRLVDVRTADEETLRQAVGSWAEGLRRLAFGEDDRPVEPEPGAQVHRLRGDVREGPRGPGRDPPRARSARATRRGCARPQTAVRADGGAEAALLELRDHHAERNSRAGDGLGRGDHSENARAPREDRGGAAARPAPRRLAPRARCGDGGGG